MGEIHADVTLENAGDREYFRRGDRAEADIRRSTVDGIVDTGAVTLVLPQNVVERLGLQTQGTAVVTYADERREERPLALPVPHNSSLDFMKPLRYCNRRGGAESGRAQPAGQPRPTARRGERGGLARR